MCGIFYHSLIKHDLEILKENGENANIEDQMKKIIYIPDEKKIFI